MKKRVIIILLVLITIVLIFKFIPFGTVKYKVPNSKVTLKVPRFSSFKNECCMFSSTFKSFSSKITLKLQLQNIVGDYEKLICNNKTYYYSEEENITISEYGVNFSFPFNEFYITYGKGKYDINECSVVTDPTKLKYEIQNTDNNYNGNCKIPEAFKYKDKNGDIHNVYYECFGDLLFQTGLGKMNYLDYMMLYGWISMDDILEFLDYQVSNNKATKGLVDTKAILYKTKDFSLLKCNKDDNQDVYIGDVNFKIKNEYCN